MVNYAGQLGGSMGVTENGMRVTENRVTREVVRVKRNGLVQNNAYAALDLSSSQGVANLASQVGRASAVGYASDVGSRKVRNEYRIVVVGNSIYNSARPKRRNSAEKIFNNNRIGYNK
jgi:hypothetical protein